MPRYALTIAYDGTDFCGWQRQEHWVAPDGPPPLHIPPRHILPPVENPDLSIHPPLDAPVVELRTIQALLQRAVREVVREPVQVQGSSRTDSGVHARGQVASFATTDDPALIAEGRGWPADRGVDRLLRAINGRLPQDILVVGAKLVPDEFDPIGNTHSKGYSYTLQAGRTRSLFERRLALHIWEDLNVQAMQHAAQRIVGTHDFAAFAAAGHGRSTTVRTVLRCDVIDQGLLPWPGPMRERAGASDAEIQTGHGIRIEVDGTGFLYNMVRIIAGTLVEVGKGKMPPEQIDRALSSGVRTDTGPTLPPNGLCLEWIRYPGWSPEVAPLSS